MLNLEHKLVLNEAAVQAANLCSRFGDDDLKRIGTWVWDGYDRDKRSRSAWEKRTNAAMELALQILKDKNFPWPNCSNVAFPLVTIAALQFHSRAYPALVSAPDIVKCRVVGEDPDGEEKARAERIASHMSYQVLEEDESWEEQHDALLINLPIVGTAFKKSYYSASLRHNVSELVLARDLVLNYWSKSVEGAPRKTHCVMMSHNDIRERALRGVYRDVLEENWFTGYAPAPQLTTQQLQVDRRQGVTTPQPDVTTPFQVLEQHLNVDLDGDGYAEPYIITVEESSKSVLRIVTRFSRFLEDIERDGQGRIIQIHAEEYFTKYPFIPSPDGGIYDVGFGILLGPLNESVNSLINQLVDAGTVQNTAGGFLGRGAKIRGGVYTFRPFEWARVDSSSDDLRKSVFPLPVNEPSAVLFQLLSLLINYANRIPGTTELLVGENPGQNTPAETSRNLMEQGLKIYTALFKRVWRAMKMEFKKLYILNGLNMPVRRIYGDAGLTALREDYLEDPRGVVPAADPNITSEAQDLQQAILLKQSAASTPGYNTAEVEKRFLKAMKVDGISVIYPGPEKIPPGKSEKIQIEELRLQGKQAEWQLEQAQFAAELMEQQRLNNAKIIELEARATKLMADIQLTAEELEGDKADRQVAILNAAIGALKGHNDSIKQQIDIILKGMDVRKAEIGLETAEAKARAAKNNGGSHASAA